MIIRFKNPFSYIRNNNYNDFKLSLVLGWYLLSIFIINATYELSVRYAFNPELISILSIVIMAGLLVYNALIIINRLSKPLVIFLCTIVLLLLINQVFIHHNEYYDATRNTFLTTVLPLAIVAYSIDNYSVLLYVLRNVALIVIPVATIMLFLIGREVADYNMGLANSLTLPAILMINTYYFSKQIIHAVFACLDILVIVALGSRGALLGIGMYLLFSLIIGFFNKRNRLISLIGVIAIMAMTLFYSIFLRFISNTFSSFGVSSRTIELLLNDSSHDSGRSEIYSSMRQELLNHPLLLRGIAGERSYTGGLYAHNVFFEIFMDFGVLFGAIICIGILSLIIFDLYSVLKKNIYRIENNDYDILIVFLFSSIPLLLVSETFWTYPYFWIWITLNLKKLTNVNTHTHNKSKMIVD